MATFSRAQSPCWPRTGILNVGAGLGRRVAYVTVAAGQMAADITLPD
jgi:hypothetical protein